MSGRKQHFIPQSLLKGFAIDPSSKIPQIWVFRDAASPYISAIKDVAAQRDFYSPPVSDAIETLDDRITSYENHVGTLLVALRATSHGTYVDARLASELTAHMCARGAPIRGLFHEGVNEMLAALELLIGDKNAWCAALGIEDSYLAAVVHKAIDEQITEIEQMNPLPAPREFLHAYLYGRLRENSGDLHSQLSPMISDVLARLRDAAPTAIRNGHAKALSAGLAPEARVNELAHMRWTVQFSQTDLILPDCVAIARAASGAWLPCQEHPESLDVVVMPLGRRQLLIGHHGADPLLDAPFVNAEAAGASVEFFVSASNSQLIDGLRAKIGHSPRQRMRDLARQAVNDYAAPSAGTANDGAAA